MKVVLTEPVETALRTLGSEDYQRVRAWLDMLEDWESDAYVRENSHKLESGENVYLLRTNTDFRIFFALQGDHIAVLDIAKKATIMRFGPLAKQGKA